MDQTRRVVIICVFFSVLLVIGLRSTLTDSQVAPLSQRLTYLNLLNPVCEIESETDPIVIAATCFPMSARSQGKGQLREVIERTINNTVAILASVSSS